MAMHKLLDLPVFGLDDTFPDEVFVLFHAASRRYGCFCHVDVHGLACFTKEQGAVQFAQWSDLCGMTIQRVSFDEARNVAKLRPMPVVALMLLDELDAPKIHYVR